MLGAGWRNGGDSDEINLNYTRWACVVFLFYKPVTQDCVTQSAGWQEKFK